MSLFKWDGISVGGEGGGKGWATVGMPTILTLALKMTSPLIKENISVIFKFLSLIRKFVVDYFFFPTLWWEAVCFIQKCIFFQIAN